MIGYPLQAGRRKTRLVRIGPLEIGGGNPPLLQSMITAPAAEPLRALDEIKALHRVGCPLVRLSLPNRKELEALPELRRLMGEEGIDLPLVADVHFSPQLAVEACEFFEKVRINPGNFSDSPKNSRPAPDDPDWFEAGHCVFAEALKPLAEAALKYGRAIRVGVNQGSLSERMMGRYGDSPEGMVRSALECCDLLEEMGLLDLVVSLKSSNPLTVQKAYRLLVELRGKKELLPLHLGVTEAGDGLMGRIKSLAGMGPLLYDGLGDTLRVSLTEPSPHEILYGRQLLKALKPARVIEERPPCWERPLEEVRVHNGGKELAGRSLGQGQPLALAAYEGDRLAEMEPAWEPDFLVAQEQGKLKAGNLAVVRARDEEDLSRLVDYQSGLVLLSSESALYELRRFYAHKLSLLVPLGYELRPEDLQGPLEQTRLAAILGEGLIDFLLIAPGLDGERLTALTYLLQATRARIFMTDYITCPSCSRTLFDLERTTALIRERTQHLKGLKLAVMGCIVNGPGEMADADFGYVGSGPGKVDLYRGQERVRRNLDASEAVEALVELIQAEGRWVEP